MLDPKYLRESLDEACQKLNKRGYVIDYASFQTLESKRKDLQAKTQELQAQRNSQSKAIGEVARAGGDIHTLKAEVSAINQALDARKAELDKLLQDIEKQLLQMPNIPDDSVPQGRDESENVEHHCWGDRPIFDFECRDHLTLGEQLGGVQPELGVKLAGSRFFVLRGEVARLHRALTQFMLDVQTQEHGYEECYVPYLVNTDSLYGTGQLPKFAQDLFHTALEGEDDVENKRAFSLIPTAEVPLTNFARDEIFEPQDLPIRLTAHTPCFRSEAGSYGRDTRGLIRVHQFDKVEMVQLVHPDKSWEALEQMREHAERVLQKLKLPYRVMTLCTGDMGFCAAKTYDLEVWLPAQDTYREISSVSNCLDFQARRMQARVRDHQGKPQLIHTLNGSGLAVGRALVAVLENYQQRDGSIRIPDVLQPYMHGQTELR